MSFIQYFENEENKNEETIDNYRHILAQYKNNIPTLVEALYQMFISSGLSLNQAQTFINDILNKCKNRIDDNNIWNKIKNKYNNVNKDDAYIICSYTCEALDKKYSPYKLLNENLVSDDREKGVSNISKYLYLFLNSLRKLEITYPKNCLFRCITVNVLNIPSNKIKVQYKIGNIKTFWGFTSTSLNIQTAYKFLKGQKGTIYSIGGNVWGYDITLFNKYNEEEILLEPERKYRIDGIGIDKNNNINVSCSLFNTPIVLKNLIDNNINFVNEDNNIININLKKNIVKINMVINNNKSILGFGILCNIPLKNMKALITYNNIIDNEFLYNQKKLIFFIENEKKEINMEISRYKNILKDLNMTIIEILNEDNINNFIEIDDYNNSKNYNNEDILYIKFNKNNNLEYFNDKIIQYNNSYIFNSKKKLDIGIILLRNNIKIIGIINSSIILMPSIINKINLIKGKFEIKKEDIGNEIQILNYRYISKKNNEIKEKIKLIINGIILRNIYKVKFSKEGIYIVYYIPDDLLTDISFMFFKCSSLKEIDLSLFNTQKLISLSGLFSDCSSLKKIKLFPFININNIDHIFENCPLLNEVNLSQQFINYCNKKKYNDQLTGLSKLCLLKEISTRINNDKLENLPKKIKDIIISLNNIYLAYVKIFDVANEKNLIKDILNKISGNNLINFSDYLDEIIDLNHLDLILDLFDKENFKQLKQIKLLLEKYNPYIKFFGSEFKKVMKKSIFDFSIVSMIIKEREDYEIFQKERANCPNRIEKILFHGTLIEPISSILTNCFYRSTGSHQPHGKGIYFTQDLDYCCNFGRSNMDKFPFGWVPILNETFTLIACSIYYNNSGFKQVSYNEYTPKKNEANFAYVGANGETLEKPDKTKFYGNEYVIYDLTQIFPFLSVKLQRNEYCIIWRDNNFDNESINNIFDKGLKEIINRINKITKYNIYYCKTTEDALSLIKRKQYNKLILISSIDRIEETKNFIFSTRKIIGNDIIVLLIDNDIHHLEWIRHFQNVLFTNERRFCIDYIECFENKDFIYKKFLALKNKLEIKYSVKFNFNDRFLYFPRFVAEGKYSDLVFN